jgi:hypothetical protein
MTDDQKTTPISKLIESRKQRMRGIMNENANEEEIPAVAANGNDVEMKNETLEQKAVREIIQAAQNLEKKSDVKVFELPIHPDELPLNGAVESTLDDYENVPIADFGKAMLRGMGWNEAEEKKKEAAKEDVPVVRPKGLGLGADKVVKKQPLLVQPLASETLEIKKHACIKILAGKHKNLYGTVSCSFYFKIPISIISKIINLMRRL